MVSDQLSDNKENSTHINVRTSFWPRFVWVSDFHGWIANRLLYQLTKEVSGVGGKTWLLGSLHQSLLQVSHDDLCAVLRKPDKTGDVVFRRLHACRAMAQIA
jgi:hypothetical protein